LLFGAAWPWLSRLIDLAIAVACDEACQTSLKLCANVGDSSRRLRRRRYRLPLLINNRLEQNIFVSASIAGADDDGCARRRV
jgi:hypothetical protein